VEGVKPRGREGREQEEEDCFASIASEFAFESLLPNDVAECVINTLVALWQVPGRA